MGSEANIVLTGFMGAGKSTTGRAVARALGREFVDMDEIIAQRAGASIAEQFAREGEAAFRARERELVKELAARQGLVIATGGGALVDAANREAFERGGAVVICLDAEPNELTCRLRGDNGRPMLWGDDPAARLRELLAARRVAYAQIAHHIDTTRRAPEQVAEEALRLAAARPRVWRISAPGGDYQAQLYEGALADVGALLRARGVAGGVAVVSDERVWPLHGERLLEGLRAARYIATPIVIPAGEQFKTLATVSALYDRFLDAGLDRSGAVVALGGGVVTDMAGFAAATYMRGVPCVVCPTTLLSMVDAAIGGKTAVDHPRGKNLIGAFSQPLFVALDPQTLATLPELERRAGLAEIIKHGVIADPELFAAFEEAPKGAPPSRRQESEEASRLEGGAPPPLSMITSSWRGGQRGEVGPAAGNAPDLRWMLERAIQVKVDVVQADPYERGQRAWLNLGHTFAHAFEALADFTLHHGLAVSIGMAAAAHLAELRGVCSAETRARIIAALQRHGLPTAYADHPPEAVYRAMQSDKKRQASKLRFILPTRIGQVTIAADVPESDVLAALERTK